MQTSDINKVVSVIEFCKPTRVADLRDEIGHSRIQLIEGVRMIKFRTFSLECVPGLQYFCNLQRIEIANFSNEECKTLLNCLKGVTDSWRTQKGSDRGIDKFIVRDCQMSSETLDIMMSLFMDGTFSNLRHFDYSPSTNAKQARLGTKYLQKLCDQWSAKKCPRLNRILLRNNALGDKGMDILKTFFDGNHLTSLTRLNLTNNSITNSGFSSLCTLFTHREYAATLEKFCVAKNRIMWKGMEDGCKHLVTCELPNLRLFDVSENMLFDKGLICMFTSLESHTYPSLKTLRFAGTKIREAGMARFAKMLRARSMPNLENLDVSHCGLGHESILNHLCFAANDGYMKSIRSLALRNNRLRDKSMPLLCTMLQVSNMPNLTHVDMSNNKLGDKGVACMESKTSVGVMQSVEVLNLDKNGISDNGANSIHSFIRNNMWPSMKELHLNDNSFSSVACIHLRSLVEMNNEIKVVFLNEMTRKRTASFVTNEGKMIGAPATMSHTSSSERRSSYVEPTDEECLREIFGAEMFPITSATMKGGMTSSTTMGSPTQRSTMTAEQQAKSPMGRVLSPVG